MEASLARLFLCLLSTFCFDRVVSIGISIEMDVHRLLWEDEPGIFFSFLLRWANRTLYRRGS